MLESTTFDAVIQLVIAAVLVEAVVTVINNAKEKYLDWRYWGAIAVGVLVAVVYDVDVFEMVGLSTSVPYVGAALSGVIVSRGSNYAYDIMKRIKNPNPNIVNQIK